MADFIDTPSDKVRRTAGALNDALDRVRHLYGPQTKMLLIVVNPPVAAPCDGDLIVGDADYLEGIATLQALGPKLREAQRG